MSQPLRIGVEATPAARQRAGIGRYARGLLGALAALDSEDHYTLVAAARGADVGALRALPFRHRRILPLPVSDRLATIAWHRLRLPLPITALTGRLDVFLALDFALPPLGRDVPGVVTVYDLAFLTEPECADPGLRAYLTKVVPRDVARAAHVLTISHSARADLIRLLDVPPERVTVAYPGLQPIFSQTAPPDTSAVRARLGLPQRFVLAVSTIEPRKNFVRLIEAVHALRGQAGTGDVELVIAGGKGWLYQPVFDRVAALGLTQQVHFVDRPDDETVRALYHLAAVVAHPALYEGFGMPPLEAMACGAPVVCSDTSSLPEVVGDAALTVDPLDTEALTEALGRVLQDDALAADLRGGGGGQAAQFTWEGTARAARAALRQAAGQP